MNPHDTWFAFLPGYLHLEAFLRAYLARGWTWRLFQTTHFEIDHVLGAILVVAFLVFGAIRYSGTLRRSGDGGLVPPPRFGLRNFFELLGDTVYGLMEGAMSEKDIRRYLPLVGSLFLFILFSNLLALIPGFLPPTDTLKTNLALAGLVFVMTHVYGARAHGFAYLKHFLGPWLPLAPLMLCIELISHIARPVSLSMRLLGNIAADHKVVTVFFAAVPLLVPVPFLVMGVFVSVIQAVVFSLLTTIYISTAVAHEEH